VCLQIVCCDYRRVPTSTYRKAFPSNAVVGKLRIFDYRVNVSHTTITTMALTAATKGDIR